MIYNGIEYTQIPYAPTYYISRCGKVLSIRSGIIKSILLSIDKDGYLSCNIHRGTGKTKKPLHRLLCNAFMALDMDNRSLCVNHIDGNKVNNSLSNIEIVYRRENTSHYMLNKRHNLIGYSYLSNTNTYKASIGIHGKTKHIGLYDTKEAAHKAYIDAFIGYGLRDKYVEQLPAYKEAMMLKGVGVSIV